MDENSKTGMLLNANNIKLHRQYFREMLRLIGIHVLYRAPKPDKHWTTYAELETNYEPPILVGCIFDQHPDQQTMKKLGWVAELSSSSSLISVDYDLPGLQVGALFIIPSGIDNSSGRLFRVAKMTTSMVYPSCVTCEIIPEWEDVAEQEVMFDFTSSNLNLLNEEQYDIFG